MAHSDESFFAPLEKLIEGRRVKLETIIEHRSDEEVPTVGTVAYEGIHTFHAFAIGWSHNGMNRTTLFRMKSWKLVKGSKDIFFLIRTAPDEGDFDLPWASANLYTLVFAPRERY